MEINLGHVGANVDYFIIFLCFLVLVVIVTRLVLYAYRDGRRDGYDDGFQHGVAIGDLRSRRSGYREGFENGKIQGMAAERERRDAEDLRISNVVKRVEDQLARDEWDKELEV